MNPKNRILSRAAFAALFAAFSPILSWRATAQTPPPPPPVAQMVFNSGFEASIPFSGWSYATTATTSVPIYTGLHAGSGLCAEEVTITAPGVDGIEQTLTGPVNPGCSYLVSAWVKVTSGSARIGLHVSATVSGVVNPSAGLVEQLISDGGSPTWHYVSGVFQLDPGASTAAMGILITSDDVGVTFDLDDVTVYPLLAPGIHNAHSATQVANLGAKAVRQVMNLYQFEDNLGAAAVAGTPTWSAASSTLSQTSSYLSTNCNLIPGAVTTSDPTTWSNYTLSVRVSLNSITTAASGVPLGNASLRFAVGSGQGYLLTISPTQLMLSKFFPGGTQVMATVSDPITTAHPYAYAVIFDTTNGILVTRDGTTKIPDGITMTTRPPVDPSLIAGSIGMGTTNGTASFDTLNVTSFGGVLGDMFTDSFANTANWTFSYPTPFVQLASVGGATVPVVFTLSFADPRNANSTPLIPAAGSAAYLNVMSEIQTFLASYGKYISIFAVENEPNNEYSTTDRTADPTSHQSPARVWLAEVAAQVKSVITASGSPVPNLKIASGAMTTVLNAYTSGNGYPNNIPGKFLTEMLNWANTDPNIDFIDFHAHQASEEEVEQDLAYLQGQTTKPLISTEWSEAGAITPAWLAQTITLDTGPSFLVSSDLPSWANITTSSKNSDYIAAAYLYPVKSTGWNNFILNAPLTPQAPAPDFLQKVTDLYNRNGVILETYGAYDQYGSAKFDLKQIYATETVRLSDQSASPPNADQANSTYLAQFQGLSPTLPASDTQIAFDNFSTAWSTLGGTWSTVTGADTYVKQTGTSGVVGYAWITATAPGLDCRVSAEITPTQFYTSANSVGLIARYSVNSSYQKSYYAALYRDFNHTVLIQKMSAGVPMILGTVGSLTLVTGQSHRFELDVAGNVIKFYVDGTQVASGNDTGTLLPAGTLGLITYAAQASFADAGAQYRDDSANAMNWTNVSGSWAEGTGGYTQSASSVTAMACLNGSGWGDYTVEAQATPSNMVGTAASIGLVARYVAGTGYYALLSRPLNTSTAGDVVLVKADGSGTQTVLRDLPISLSSTQAMGLKLEVQGNQIRGYLNGRMILSEQDTSLPALTAGAAGVITNNSLGSFANVVVTQLNP